MSPPVIVIAGTSSGVGKTTVSCGLMAAFSTDGLTVQPFKVGPDFLDGKHHEQATGRRSVNLDGWMMGGKEAVLESFHRHARGADLCIVEGVMGLHDSKDGESDDGSTAQIAKWLQAPVVLVVDAHSMARSVAAMVLGYLMLDEELRLSAVVVNKVSGKQHIEWIKQALKTHRDRLVDVQTQQPILFAGAMPQDRMLAIPERHMGLVMPSEHARFKEERWRDKYSKLAAIVQDNLDLDSLLNLAKSATPPKIHSCGDFSQPGACDEVCRIGVARDDAFSFYYGDNLKLLQDFGAELVLFSPVHDTHLPSGLDALYIGGGYPELHGATLQSNESMRHDIKSFAKAGGLIYAECGGLMFLAEALWTMTRKDDETDDYDRQRYQMCSVLPGIVVSMTPHMKMGYAEIEMAENPIFQQGRICRGQQFHFSEVVTDDDSDDEILLSPFLVTAQHLGAQVEKGGYVVANVLASYFHLHWSSNPALARDFVESAVRTSPIRKMFAISFVSAATEIIFRLGAENSLAGITSVCDYPKNAQDYPRRIISRSPFDASTMTSEEVDAAMKEHQSRKGDGPPGYWIVDTASLKEMVAPRVAFVQETCDICDVAQSDVLLTLEQCGLSDVCKTVQVSPTTLEGMFQSILDVGAALHVQERSVSLCAHLRQRLDVVATKINELGLKQRPRVLSLEGLSPICVGGNWLPDVKTAAGCDDALCDVGGSPARVLQWSDVEKADPDVLILSPCSATTSRTLNELYLLNTPEFWKLRCVRNGDVYVIDHSKFSRPGPRLVDGVELLATLLCGVTPPDHVDATQDWKSDALKYECRVGKVKHCTTELSTRFKPCFGDHASRGQDFEPISKGAGREGLQRIRTTRSSATGHPLPCDRSAHNMAALKDGSVIIFAGEDDDGKRLSDTWKLSAPQVGWNESLDPYDTSAPPQRGRSPVWELLLCGKVADENVPTKRSNSGSVVCGDYFLVFGGWGVDSQCLGSCELLHLDTLCWTHCSVRGTNLPSPRGNPTLVYSEKTNSAIMFGGWNKVERLSELWVLDMTVWDWELQVQHQELPWPKGRTDHSSVLWTNDSGQETMLIFGGSLDTEGCCNELWILDIYSWRWQAVKTHGPSPEPRSSHTAAIAGQGSSATMILVGGSGNGSGRSVLLEDAWLLRLETMTWTRVSWHGSGVARCRQVMSVVNGGTALVWGGYDGEKTSKDDASVWVGSLDKAEKAEVVASTASKPKQLQERWQAEVPIRESDLPEDMLAKARRSNLPGALFKTLHRYAVAQQRDTYIDPASGYSVFTQTYLKRKPCCGNGCRHCPHGHINVPKCAGNTGCDPTQLEW